MASDVKPDAAARTDERLPPVTVIVPTFNRSRYLVPDDRERARAGLARLHADGCRQRVRRRHRGGAGGYQGPWIHYLRRPENIGWLRNFNDALGAIRTRFVTVLNDDDLMDARGADAGAWMLEPNPDVGMVHVAHDSIGPDGAVLERGSSWSHGLVRDTIEPGRTFLRRARLNTTSSSVRRAWSSVPRRSPRSVTYRATSPHAVSVLYLRIAVLLHIGYLAASGSRGVCTAIRTRHRWPTSRPMERWRGTPRRSPRCVTCGSGSSTSTPTAVHVGVSAAGRVLRRRRARCASVDGVRRRRVAVPAASLFGRCARRRRCRVRPETWRLVVRTGRGPRGVRMYHQIRRIGPRPARPWARRRILSR